MEKERLLRIAALAAIPLIGVFLYASREPEPKAAVAKGDLVSAASSNSELAARVRERGEAAFASGEEQVARALPTPVASKNEEPTQARALPPWAPEPLLSPAKRRNPSSRRGASTASSSGPCGELSLRGVTLSSDKDWSFASLSLGPGEPTRLRKRGDRIGSYRVMTIAWNRVTLAGARGRCALAINETKNSGLELEPFEEEAPQPPGLSRELKQGIARVANDIVEIDRALLDALFDPSAKHLSGVKLEPVIRGERTVGVQLVEVPKDSLLSHIGIESGDIVLALNDAPATTPEGIAQSLEQARKSPELTLKFSRGGAEHTLTLRVV